MRVLPETERQVAPTLSGIRRDHVARYEWASHRIGDGDVVVDCGCGVGYGSLLLGQVAAEVVAFDRDSEAIGYAKAHYGRWRHVFHSVADASKEFPLPDDATVGVAFEVIEHLPDPRALLRRLARRCRTLFASVPNERVFPFENYYAHHHRHYTREEFENLLNECGWKVAEWWGQAGKESEVERNLEGRTLVVKASRVNAAEVIEMLKPPAALLPALAPKHVALIGLGPSAEAYMDHVKRLGSRQAFCDQVWAINGLGSVLDCDLVFHMDDVRIQEIRAAARPLSNIANMVRWLKTTKVPVMTSVAHPDYPSLVPFPLEAVVNKLGRGYFNNTSTYAVAYAIYLGVEKISLFGCDFSYPDAHKAEKGRACLEFWLGYAAKSGIQIATPQETTLLDACEDTDDTDIPSYGYDLVKIACATGEDGSFKLSMTPREGPLPTADQIESAYDHGRPPAEQHRRPK